MKVNKFKIIMALAMSAWTVSKPVSAAAGGMISFGLKGGLTLSKTSETLTGYTGPSFGTGFLGGLGADIGIGPLDLLVDAFYAQRVVKYTGDINVKTNSIMIPVLLAAKFNMLMIEAGGYISMGMGNITLSNSAGSASYTYAESFNKKTDFGLTAGLGASFPTGAMKVSLEARYNFGLVNLIDSPLLVAAGSSRKSQSLDFIAGLWF